MICVLVYTIYITYIERKIASIKYSNVKFSLWLLQQHHSVAGNNKVMKERLYMKVHAEREKTVLKEGRKEEKEREK